MPASHTSRAEFGRPFPWEKGQYHCPVQLGPKMSPEEPLRKERKKATCQPGERDGSAQVLVCPAGHRGQVRG